MGFSRRQYGFFALVVAMSAVASGVILARQPAPATRAVSVSLSLHDTAGAAIPSATFVRGLALTHDARWAATTDASGQASATASVPVEDHFLELLLGRDLRSNAERGGRSPVDDPKARLAELKHQGAFLIGYRVPITATNTANAAIVVSPTVTLKTKIKRGSAVAGECAVKILEYAGAGSPESSVDGSVVIGGAPKGQGGTLVVLDGNRLDYVPFSAQQSDATIADVVLPPRGREVPVELRIVSQWPLPDSPTIREYIAAATLIKADGSFAYCFARDDLSGALVRPNAVPCLLGDLAADGTRTPKLPPGDYWLVPFSYVLEPAHIFRRALLAGHDFSGAGLLKVTVEDRPAGAETQVVQFDCLQVRSRFIQVYRWLCEAAGAVVGPLPPPYIRPSEPLPPVVPSPARP